MRILIDGRFIGVGESISRYTLEIVQGILKLDQEHEYTLLIRPQGEKFIADNLQLKAKNFRTKVLDIPHYSFKEQTELLKYLNSEKFDLVHFTQFNHPIRYKGNYVISVHDLTLLGHLHRMNIVKRLGFRAVMKSAIMDSRKIITISNTTKDDLVETYRIDPDKIAITYLGVDNKYNSNFKSQSASWRTKIRDFKEKYKTGEKYILYTGMWKRHKNLLRMFDAFERAKLSDVKLVLVGKIDKEEPEILKRIDEINSKQKIIVTTGFVEEEELPIAYAGAVAYCIPSLSEGFGLPPLEAMACGTPVISSAVSAMPEILGKAAFYFDPYDIEDMSMAMKTIVEDEKLQKELSQKGLKWVARYDWEKTAKETLDVYKSLLK
ncbi:MAG: glycosyltransferase family 1 protein [Patescibacteria group bacterium]